MSQTLVLSPHHSEVGDPFTATIESSTAKDFNAPSDRLVPLNSVEPRQRIMERGEILGVMVCEVPFHRVIDPDLMIIQSSPVITRWPFSGTGKGSQPFVALFPSGAVRGVSALLHGGQVEFSLPMELIDPDLDPVPGMPFRFELFQFAPHPRDRATSSSNASQSSAFEEPVLSVPST